jgi:hypothetical protein
MVEISVRFNQHIMKLTYAVEINQESGLGLPPAIVAQVFFQNFYRINF